MDPLWAQLEINNTHKVPQGASSLVRKAVSAVISGALWLLCGILAAYFL